MYSDCHCHLETFRGEQLSKAMARAGEKKVTLILSVGSDLASSERVVNLAKSTEGVFAACGIHPWWAVSPDTALREGLEALIKDEHVVAIGEIGLDYAKSPDTRKLQREVFSYQVSLAGKAGLPVNIHCQQAHQDMMGIMHENGTGVTGVIHGFTGSLAELRDWLELGFYVSFGVRGFVVDAPEDLEEAARQVPEDRLLTETDCLCLPDRQMGEPADVLSVVQKLASIQGTDPEVIGGTATANLKRLLKL